MLAPRRTRALPFASRTALIITVSALGLTSCGQPEEPLQPAAAVSTAPLPPLPAWSSPLMGQLVSKVSNGRGVCKGAFDVVSMRHGGARPGVEVAGWGWDATAKQPIQHVLLTNSADRVVGVAQGGALRVDVPKALRDVASPNTGWRGATGVTRGTLTAIGLTQRNAACTIGILNVNP